MENSYKHITRDFSLKVGLSPKAIKGTNLCFTSTNMCSKG